MVAKPLLINLNNIGMIIDITLAIIFFASIITLWYRISIKIPELIAIPDEVITARLEEDSAKLHLFLLHLKSYYREKKYEEVFWRVWGKTLYKFHIGLMRLDNGTVGLLKRVRAHAGATNGNNGNSNGEYWKQLKEEPPSPKKEVNRIQEIKVK